MNDINISMESKASVARGFLPKPKEELKSHTGEKKLDVEVAVSDDGEVIVSVTRSNGMRQEYPLLNGDILYLDHVMHLNATRGIRDDHLFPIVLEYKNQNYKLQKTKNDKLILTK